MSSEDVIGGCLLFTVSICFYLHARSKISEHLPVVREATIRCEIKRQSAPSLQKLLSENKLDHRVQAKGNSLFTVWCYTEDAISLNSLAAVLLMMKTKPYLQLAFSVTKCTIQQDISAFLLMV